MTTSVATVTSGALRDEALQAVEDRVLWLSAAIVDVAPHGWVATVLMPSLAGGR